MTQDRIRQILDLFNQREHELEAEYRAYEIGLGLLEPISSVCVGGGIVLPLIAGFTLLGQSELFGRNWELFSGGLSLLAAILTGIHTGFKCEQHQAECRRLIKELKSLAEDYEAAKVIPENELEAKLNELETRRRELRKSITVRPANWCTRRAKRELKVAKST